MEVLVSSVYQYTPRANNTLMNIRKHENNNYILSSSVRIRRVLSKRIHRDPESPNPWLNLDVRRGV